MFRRVFLFFMIMMLTSLALPLPESHAQLRTGDILVTDEFAGTGGAGALFRVDPVTGARTILSDFGSANLEGVAVYAPPAPVGGYVVPSNKLAILTPYIVLAGLIAAISAVYVIKKRKD